MRFYIADLHFFHANMNYEMDMRGFENAEQMNEYMIKCSYKKNKRTNRSRSK